MNGFLRGALVLQLVLLTGAGASAEAASLVCAERCTLQAAFEGGVLRVQSPVQLDWERHAPWEHALPGGDDGGAQRDAADFMAAAPRTPGEFGNDVARVRYPVPDPGWLRTLHLYLVSAEGIAPLVPLGLEGEALLVWDREEPAILLAFQCTGVILAQPARRTRSATGGVVVASRTPLALQPLPPSARPRKALPEGVTPLAEFDIDVDSGAARYRFTAWEVEHNAEGDASGHRFRLVEIG